MHALVLASMHAGEKNGIPSELHETESCMLMVCARLT